MDSKAKTAKQTPHWTWRQHPSILLSRGWWRKRGGVWWWRGSGTEQRSLAAARDWHENVGVDARIFAHALVKVSVQRLNSRLAERREDFTCVVSLLAPLTTPRVHFTVYLPCRHDFMQSVEATRRFGKRLFIYVRPSALYFENFHYNDLHSRKQATQLFKLYVLNKIQERTKKNLVLPFKSRACQICVKNLL